MTDTTKKSKKKVIPKNIKDQTWDHWVGKDKGSTTCYCCEKTEIRQSSFHAGHVVAESKEGTTTVDNLRPICRSCNQSMGTMNMDEYKETYKPHIVLEKKKKELKPKSEKKVSPPKALTPKEKMEEFQKGKSDDDILEFMNANTVQCCIPNMGNQIHGICPCGIKTPIWNLIWEYQKIIADERGGFANTVGLDMIGIGRKRFIDCHLIHYFQTHDKKEPPKVLTTENKMNIIFGDNWDMFSHCKCGKRLMHLGLTPHLTPNFEHIVAEHYPHSQ